MHTRASQNTILGSAALHCIMLPTPTHDCIPTEMFNGGFENPSPCLLWSKLQRHQYGASSGSSGIILRPTTQLVERNGLTLRWKNPRWISCTCGNRQQGQRAKQHHPTRSPGELKLQQGSRSSLAIDSRVGTDLADVGVDSNLFGPTRDDPKLQDPPHVSPDPIRNPTQSLAVYGTTGKDRDAWHAYKVWTVRRVGSSRLISRC
eukprot:3940010-Rhodomonas_salina.2